MATRSRFLRKPGVFLPNFAEEAAIREDSCLTSGRRRYFPERENPAQERRGAHVRQQAGNRGSHRQSVFESGHARTFRCCGLYDGVAGRQEFRFGTVAAAVVVPRMLFAVTPAIFAGMIFVYLYAGKFASSFIDELLFPKRYLKNVPVTLAKVPSAAASVILRSSGIRSAAYQNVAELCVFCSTPSAGIWSSSRTCVNVAKISRK